MEEDRIQSGSLREHAEELETQTLSPYAMLSRDTRGREYPMEKCPIRTEFVRDRDRIIHCKSFRRLKHKTQVFLSPVGDHYRTRLTHTLEVSQIARTISRGLRLNEDLTEAIALGHDLGHTPFGHAGESVLDRLVPGGFEHNVQSLRVVEKLENGTGLNLTGASVVVHADPWWNAAATDQATDRAHRIGQNREVDVYKVVAKGTIEERIVALQEAKRDLADSVIAATAGEALAGLTRERLAELLGEAD